MGILISILLTASLSVQVAILYKLAHLEPKKEEPKSEAKPTDPFEKPKEVFSSTQHIVVRKTPDQIRNENYDRIKNGETYGNANKW